MIRSCLDVCVRCAVTLAVLLLAACASPPRSEGSANSLPAGAGACRTVTRHVDGLAMDTQDCHLSTGHWQVRADPALPGLVLWRDQERIATVLQTFAKAPDDGVDAVLPRLRALGLIPDDGDCRFVPAALRPLVRTQASFEIRPTGRRLERLQATPAGEVPDPPCGAVGWSTHGVRYFLTDLRRPDRVVFLNEGQDGTQILPPSLRWVDGH
jgi:hypothetical protein